MRETLEQVLEDELRQAAVLKHNDHLHDSTIIERICARVSAAARDYLEFVNEREAQLATGHSVDYLRSRFERWEARGHAKRVGGKRFYRQMILDPRANLVAAREAGRQAARGG